MSLQTELTELQPIVMNLFTRSIREKRLSHGYLFEGARGTGKKRTALWLAQSLFCTNQTDDNLACGQCTNCKRILNDNYPDVHWLIPSGTSIKIDQVRDLKSELNKRGMESDQKVLIIDEAEKMTVQSANSLLKFIEEPEGGMLLIFITDSPARILPTIKSRLQPVAFKELTFANRVEQFEKAGIGSQKARIYASLTGSGQQALNWDADENFATARSAVVKLYQGLHHEGVDPLILIQDEWMPLFKEKAFLTVGLELLLLLYRDRLHLTLSDHYQPVCKAQADILRQDALKIPLTKTTNEIHFILEAKARLESNMNTQLLMEQLTLKIQGR